MARPNNGARLATNSRGIYEIRWTEAGRSKRVSTGTNDLQEAQRILAGWLVEKEKEDTAHIHPTISLILDDYYSEHVEEQVIDKERAKDCIEVLKTELGDFQVDELTANRIANYKNRRKKGLVEGWRPVSDSTLRRELNCLIAACNHARKQKRITANDMPIVILPPAPPAKDLWLTMAESDALIQEAAKSDTERMSRIHRFVVIAIETASRKMAILKLRWNQVDFKAKIIHFQADGTRQKNKRRVPVPISDRLMPLLKRAYDERVKCENPNTELVMDFSYDIRPYFDALTESMAKSTKNPKWNDVTPHTLRHTWATQAAIAGVDMWQIAGVLGDSIKTVTKNYLHHSPDHLRSAVNFRSNGGALNGAQKPK